MEQGGKIDQETRGWDDIKQKTIAQRSKEQAHDYRYFPEPDLPPLTKEGFDIEKIKSEIPELPNAKRKRFLEQYKVSQVMIGMLIDDREMSNYFEQAVSELEADEQEEINFEKIKLILNYLSTDLRGLLMAKGIGFSESKINPENFADLIDMIAKKEISSRVAKDLMIRMIDTGLDPREIVKTESLGQISDEAGLHELVLKILKENPKAADDLRSGKEQAVMFLIGKAMAALKGRGNPEVLKKLFRENI